MKYSSYIELFFYIQVSIELFFISRCLFLKEQYKKAYTK